MVKRSSSWLIALLAIWIGLMLANSAHAKTILKLGHVGHAKGPIGAGAERFASNLRAVSGKRMDVQVVARGALGGISEMWVQMRSGSLDMQVIDIGAITRIRGAERVNVMLTPFLFSDQTHLRRYLNNDLFLDMINEVSAITRIRYLGIVSERSPRVISTTKKSIRTAEDLAGVKMRVPKLPMFVDVFESWGAIPIPVNPPEMFMALKTGLAEGEDNGVINLANGSLIEVIRHFTPINWLRTGVAAWISDGSWEKLSEQERTWVVKAIAQSTKEAAASFEVDIEKAMAKLRAADVHIHVPELNGFRMATDRIIDLHEGKLWPEGEVERIQSLR